MTRHKPRKGVELFREGDAYLVTVDVGEYDREDVACRWDDGVVTIAVDSAGEDGPDGFRRQIGLPGDVDEGGIEASLSEGVLEVTLPVGDGG